VVEAIAVDGLARPRRNGHDRCRFVKNDVGGHLHLRVQSSERRRRVANESSGRKRFLREMQEGWSASVRKLCGNVCADFPRRRSPQSRDSALKPRPPRRSEGSLSRRTARIVVDERLGHRPLVDDDEPLVSSCHRLEDRMFVARIDRETVVL